LSDFEKKISKANLITMEEDLEYYQGEQKKIDLYIELAPLTYKKQMRDMIKNKKAMDEAVKDLQSSISTLKDQIENGVLPKNKEK
jgi:hypothetical protein